MPLSFIDRHNGPSTQQMQEMLRLIGVKDMETLVEQTVPADIRLKKPLDLDAPLSENELLAQLKTIASKNKSFRSLIGMGYYRTASLPVILRNVFENPGWYTSYTPYQAEISQGRLEALVNYQTMICSLTGFPLANCSLLDEATAAAEAMRMMYELRSRAFVKEGRNVILVDRNCFPQTLAVMHTRAASLGLEIVLCDVDKNSTFAAEMAQYASRAYGVFVQYPGADGALYDFSTLCAQAHEQGLLVAAACDLLSLAVLKEPASWGADIAVGNIQRFGLPMGFGGPHAGYMACHDSFKRNMPGRIIGISVDRLGNPAYRLALQTREQHIKREKATSNICTASALMAVMAGLYAMYHGKEGITQIARNGQGYAHAVASKLHDAGYTLKHENFFDTIEITNVDAADIRSKALAAGMNFFYPDSQSVRISFDELSSCAEAKAILDVFWAQHRDCPGCPPIPNFLNRTTPILTEPIFERYHSETEMMRYIKTLENRDISLTHSMIPLGSCTMKLNAAVEMMPLSWSEFSDVHPFAPTDQVAGTMELIHSVEHDLAIITGFQACSLQPNSGAAGEYTGLSVIRAYRHATGSGDRNVAIIPTSAHGTNPASAAMAGMEIVLVGCDQNGNINVEELRQKAEANKDRLSCMMITYPSTHGVFEVKIKEICDIIHKNGGLVYMDGANMNAQVGLTNPGFIGADICHLNLHKTFAMPHGGGGPGVGPVCCTKALAPYLPGHPLVACRAEGNTVGGAPYGSPLLLPITYAYIKLLGEEGLRRATECAILNANYLSHLLYPRLKTLYTGATGRVAHECIIDLQHFSKTYGVDATDVAKRLMDFGFHAPTLSFPVHETLMIEPTESEPKAEMDRFAQALLCILDECEGLAAGKEGYGTPEDNPLKNAPHTAAEVCANEWHHAYARETAAYPLPWIVSHKFWPYVTRVDNGYGDRNLVCVCTK